MQEKKQIIVIGIIATAIIGIFSVPVAMAAYLKIQTPKQGQQVPANQFLTVVGSSTPSNTTRTNCTVMLQTNQHGYKPVQSTAKDGTYTNWKGLTSEMIKVGINQVEGQYQCFIKGTHTPNFTHHLVHNVTGVTTAAAAATAPTIAPG
jgi:hypothetical protein